MEEITISRAEYEKYLALESRCAELQQQVNFFMEQFRLAQKKRFGASSEQTNCEQLSLFNEIEETAKPEAAEPKIEVVKEYHRQKKSRLSKESLPEDLPVIEKEYTLPEEELLCTNCETKLTVIGKETRERLVIEPAKVSILREIRYIYCCRRCDKENTSVPIKKAVWPKTLIPGSIVTAEAAAHVMVQKFVMGSPLYRQEQEFESNGVPLSRQTMSNWLLECSERYLKPVVKCLHEQLVKNDILHADETTLQVLHEEGKKAQSKSYMWLYRTGSDAKEQIVLYDYKASRSGEHAREYLKGFSGYLHTDGYAGYRSMQPGITVVGCWAHCRRKFDEALKALPEKARPGTNAQKGLQYCDKLFYLENCWKDLSPDERQLKREQEAKPTINEFYKWLRSLAYSTKTLFGRAVEYALNQQKHLENYLLDGRLEISNNLAERSIKPFVISRKNFLFANTPKGASASAAIFSLIETAKANNLAPYEYLKWLLTKAAGHNLETETEFVKRLTPQAYISERSSI